MPDEPTLHSKRTLTLRFDIPISKTHEFWESLRGGKFVTTKCTECGNVTFPPQADCPKCAGGEFEWVDLGHEARLVTFTRVQVPPASFAGSGPYAIAIGEFPGRVKVLARLEEAEPKKTAPGMKLRIEARSVKDGDPYYVFLAA
jgi:uncharacterized OB-fold protein